jgi:hypothetical protein
MKATAASELFPHHGIEDVLREPSDVAATD